MDWIYRESEIKIYRTTLVPVGTLNVCILLGKRREYEKAIYCMISMM